MATGLRLWDGYDASIVNRALWWLVVTVTVSPATPPNENASPRNSLNFRMRHRRVGAPPRLAT